MNTSALVMALDDDVMAVECVFCQTQAHIDYDDYDWDNDTKSEQSKKYTYKTVDKTIKEGDLVIVEYGNGRTQFGYYIVKVTKVNVNVDFKNNSIKYKWVVGKVDTDLIKAIKKSENDIIDKVKSTEKKFQKKQIFEALGVDTSELKLNLEYKAKDVT
jgi:hypothetical protein